MNDRTRGAAALGMSLKEGFIDKQGKVHSRSVKPEEFDPRIVGQIVEAIRPLLKGFPPEIQGAALCDLTAIWLAGYVGPDRAALRKELYDHHFERLWELVAVNEQLLMERIKPEGSG